MKKYKILKPWTPLFHQHGVGDIVELDETVERTQIGVKNGYIALYVKPKAAPVAPPERTVRQDVEALNDEALDLNIKEYDVVITEGMTREAKIDALLATAGYEVGKAKNDEAPAADDEIDYLKMPVLRKLAAKEKADIKGLKSKVDVLAAIKAARAAK